jgi:hypothetical protein
VDRQVRAPIALAFYALVLGGAIAGGSFGHRHTKLRRQSQPEVVCPSLDVRCGVPVGSVDATVGSRTIVIRETPTTAQP